MLKKPILAPLLYSLLFVASAGLFFYLPNGVDYIHGYHPVTQAWLQGVTNLYDEQSLGFYSPPWLVWLLTPLVALPIEYGLAVLRAISLVIIVYGLVSLSAIYDGYARLWAIILGLVNLHNFDLIFRGQIDALAVLGTILVLKKRNWFLIGVGYTLMSTKPPNFLPIILCLAWLEFQQKPIREFAKTLVVPIFIFSLSLIIHGLWPLRWPAVLQASPPPLAWKTTIWRAAEVLDLPPILPLLVAGLCVAFTIWLWQQTSNPLQRFCLVVTLTYLITIYALSYHYVALLVLVFVHIMAWRKSVGGLLYALTFLPFLRLFIGVEQAYLDIIFVIALFVAVAVWIRTDKQVSTLML